MNVIATTTPVRVQSVRERLLYDELVLYAETSETVHILNRTAAAIWGLCDGKHDVKQMTTELAHLFGRRPASIRKDIIQMVEELRRVGLISTDQNENTSPHQESHYQKSHYQESH